ncbi:MAG: DUF4350 domain-containing protein [Planctomycetota bacterium]
MRRAIWIAIVLGSMVLAARYLGEGGGEEMGGASSYLGHRGGARALAETLQEMNIPVEAWRRRMSALDLERTGDVLFVLAPSSDLGPDEIEVVGLTQWVRAGNTVVWLLSSDRRLSRGTRALLSDLSVRRTAKVEHAETELPVTVPIRYVDGVHSLRLPGRQSLSLDAGGLAWIGSAPESVAIAGFEMGKGLIVLGAEVDLATNAGLTQGDNLALLLNVIQLRLGPESRVWFDEYHHGFRDSDRLDTWHDSPPWLWLAAHLVILFGLYVVTRRRIGPRRGAPDASRRAPAELAESLAELYRRARQRRAALERTRDRVYGRLHQRLGADPRRGDAEVAQRLAPEGGRRYDVAAQALETLRRSNDDPDDADVVAAGRAAARLERLMSRSWTEADSRG